MFARAPLRFADAEVPCAHGTVFSTFQCTIGEHSPPLWHVTGLKKTRTRTLNIVRMFLLTLLRFTPPADAFGTVKLGYEMQDSKGNTCKSAAVVKITPVNDAPVATTDTLELDASRAKLKPKGVDCSKGAPKECVGLFTKAEATVARSGPPNCLLLSFVSKYGVF